MFWAVLTLATAGLAWVVQKEFWQYQADVDRILRQLTPAERSLSPAATDALLKLHGESLTWQVTRGLLLRVAPQQVKMGEWHVRGLIWQYLLPLRLSQTQRIALYAHVVHFDGGDGLPYAAERYYRTTPDRLSAHQMIGLLVTAQQPWRVTPERDRPEFERRVARLELEYRNASPN